jgi:hypothetical protein
VRLRTVLESENLTPGRPTHTTRRTSECTELRRGPIDAGIFTVPAGYTRVDAGEYRAARAALQQAYRDSIWALQASSLHAKTKAERDSIARLEWQVMQRQAASWGGVLPEVQPPVPVRVQRPAVKKP